MLSPNFFSPDKLFILAGPCVIESETILDTVSKEVTSVCRDLGINVVLKSSFKKANRTKIGSFSGGSAEENLSLLQAFGLKYNVPTVTDIHEIGDAATAARFVDVLQIPAFLSRQTDLLVAAGETGKYVNIKKGQFSGPDQMQFAAEKVASTGNKNILLTDRGTFFGYQDLVVDMRGFPIMNATGYPTIMDCTHSLQKPNQSAGVAGGDPAMIETIALSAIAAGVKGLFIETNPDPANALSDGANMLNLSNFRSVITKASNLFAFMNQNL